MPPKKRNSDLCRMFDLTVCAFCGRDDDDEVLYGKLNVSDTITLHGNCMFFASGLCQKGDETEGFSGFLPSDIEAELRRGKKLFCSYCRKRGATVGCSEVKCKKSFHLNCGIEHGSLQQFFGSFQSFCKDHSPKQKRVQVTDELYCHICCEKILSDELNSCLYSPCCRKNWFHKICLQKYALSAGLYFFKCPLCNNSQEFIEEMETHGIYIPNKDASWELEDNAYQELLLKPECDAPICLCSKGRKYCPQKKSGWTLLPCSYCGYHARHKNCENIKLGANRWVCEECKALEEEIKRNKAYAQSVIESIPGKNEEKSHAPEIRSVPSSSSLCISSSLVLQNSLNKVNKKNSLQTDICNVTSSSSLYHTNTDVISNVDVCNTGTTIPYAKNIKTGHASEILESAGDMAKNSFAHVPIVNRLKTCALDKQMVNLKDIKYMTHNSVMKRSCGGSKTYSTKKFVKKRKIDASCCSPNHNCIRKYFGQKCGKYRI